MFCTLVGSNGAVVSVADLSQCDPLQPAYLSASELSVLMQQASAASQSSSLTVAELFAYPTSDQLLQVFQIGFFLPLQVYLLAWVYGVLLSFFKIED